MAIKISILWLFWTTWGTRLGRIWKRYCQSQFPLSAELSPSESIICRSLISAAENIGWPMPIDYAFVPPESRKEFEAAFLKLTKLQSMSVFWSWTCTYFSFPYLSGKNILGAQLEEGGLYPLQALVQPVSLRFKYHFQGTRQTNRLEKVCEITIILHCFYFHGLPSSAWVVLYPYLECRSWTTAISWIHYPKLTCCDRV